METDSLPFDVCLADAQKLGYAEADPTFDVGGFDTAHKLAILASLAFGRASTRVRSPSRASAQSRSPTSPPPTNLGSA